ncbi:MAG: paraquat-inducible protein A [Rhodobacteraceae bacterium]|nr:paraquat-inducible protein A [Paracoccaceae bacterium]
MLKIANLSLLILFPVAWFAPLLRAGLLPFFSLDEISVISGLQVLWEKDVFLALLVTFLALVAPMIKVIGTALIQFDLLNNKVKPVLTLLGRLAMADVFLVAIYIVAAKGVGIGRLETGWGLYLFTFCVLASYGITLFGKTPKLSVS